MKKALTLTAMKMSEVKTALQLKDENVITELKNLIQDDKHIIELRDTTNCIMFIRDEHNNTMFNVYDTFRIQFTTIQAKKYKDELLKDKRFTTRDYKHNEFIQAKSKDMNDFIDLCKYCYKVIATVDNKTVEKATTTATKAKTTATKAKQSKTAK